MEQERSVSTYQAASARNTRMWGSMEMGLATTLVGRLGKTNRDEGHISLRSPCERIRHLI